MDLPFAQQVLFTEGSSLGNHAFLFWTMLFWILVSLVYPSLASWDFSVFFFISAFCLFGFAISFSHLAFVVVIF